MHHVEDAAVEILFKGSPLSEGPKPAIFYFAISAEDSLSQDPFCQPIDHLEDRDVRLISITLPFHEKGLDPYKAIELWAKNLKLLITFIDNCEIEIRKLLDSGHLVPGKIGMMGLSRGGLIALHLAARIPEIASICGFAPVTQISALSEFSSGFADKYEPKHLIDKLYARKIRFYIGNHDTRVLTRSCYEWIEAATDCAIQNGISSPNIELTISPSIGRHGHGTAKHTFEAGAEWTLNTL